MDYVFIGWYTDSSLTTEFTASTISADITLYAKWVKEIEDPSSEADTTTYTRCNVNNTPNEQGDYILFGSYPQTLKEASVNVDEITTKTQGEFTYYKGSDNEWYAKVVADPFGSDYVFSDNSSVTEGSTYYFKVEPIRWRILTENYIASNGIATGDAMIFCDSIIQNKAYDEGKSNNYENSDIRAWLNDQFYDIAFTEIQKGLIQITNVDNGLYSTTDNINANICNNTTDKIFLLSAREAINPDYGFYHFDTTKDLARRITTSDYSRASGAKTSTDAEYKGKGYWWFRSPNYYSKYNVSYGLYNGTTGCYTANNNANGVAPALVIKLASDTTAEAHTISFDSNGGSEIDGLDVKNGETAVLSQAPTRDGYTFEGWYVDNGLTTAYTASTLEHDIILYAKWAIVVINSPLEMDTYTRCNADNSPNEQGDYILFGSYPQTIKDASVSIDESTATTQGEFTYCKGSDDEWYVKTVAILNKECIFSDNSSMTYGSSYYFKVEPIRWRILTEDYTNYYGVSTGDSLIICDSIIQGKVYEKDYNNNYECSEIRTWLNERFYNMAFTSLQQELIQTIRVDNSVGSTGYGTNTNASNDTYDKIFLPSYTDMINSDYGFNSDIKAEDTARVRATSDYSRVTRAFTSRNKDEYYGNGIWWLRSPTSLGVYDVRRVSMEGMIDVVGVASTEVGVVPMLVISLPPKPIIETHTISFDSNGGTEIDGLEVEAGETLVLPQAPTKADHNFIGWFTDSDLTTEFTASTISQDITLYAKWQEYTIQDHYDAVDWGSLANSNTNSLAECVEQNESTYFESILLDENGTAPTQEEVDAYAQTVYNADKGYKEVEESSNFYQNGVARYYGGTVYYKGTYFPNIFEFREGIDSATKQVMLNNLCPYAERAYKQYGDIYYQDTKWNYFFLQNYIEIADLAITFDGQTLVSVKNAVDVVLPMGLTSITNSAFSGCGSLTSIDIPDSVTNIGASAFNYCTNITSVVLPEGLTTLNNDLFNNCNSLTSVTLPNSLLSIGSDVFGYCTSLLSIVVPNNTTSIGTTAFNNCINLSSIVIGASVETIGFGAFSYCIKLVEVYNLSSLDIEAGSLTNNCVAQMALDVYTDINTASKLSTDEEGFVIYIDGNKRILVNYLGDKANVVIPQGVTAINSFALAHIENIVSVEVPEGIETIGESAFSSCSNLSNITLQNGLLSIGDNAFRNCDALENITIPTSVEGIGEDAFNSSGLVSVEIPDSVEFIGRYAFWNCEALTNITFAGLETWYVTTSIADWENKTNGTEIAVTDRVTVVENFSNTYKNYYWYRIAVEQEPITDIDTYVRCNADNTPNEQGDYILFGSYPQTLKEDSVTIYDDIITESGVFTYYKGSDDAWYSAVTANPYDDGYNFSNDISVEDGTTYYFKVEPVRWRILTENYIDGSGAVKGNALVLCDSIIASVSYDCNIYKNGEIVEYPNNNYCGSNVRAWLNSQFYNSAFTALQKTLIQTAEVDNSLYSTKNSTNEYVCENTEDKVFLLSNREVGNTAYGFSNFTDYDDNNKVLVASDYARATGSWISTDSNKYGTASWLLRSPSCNSYEQVSYINENGRLLWYANVSTKSNIAPVLTIQLN